MAVEVKAHVSTEDVTAHLKRLVTLRRYEKDVGIQNKELCGAVTGIEIDRPARNFALKNGLYVLDIIEEEKKLKVDTPKQYCVW
jgi:hypothetical protein